MEPLVTRCDNEQEWNSYVRSHEYGSPFHLTNWRDAIENAFGHKSIYLEARKDGKISGILPLIHVRSILFGNILSSVAFAAYGGILADDRDTFEVLVREAKKISKEYNTDYVDLKFLSNPCCDLPSTDIYVTFIKELSADNDANLKAIPRKQRAMVRKGIKSGLKSIVSKDRLDDFYGIFAVNVHRLGTPVYSKKWFKALLDAYGDEAEILVVEYEGKVISGVMSFYYGDTVLPYYAASLIEYRKFAPNDFQYWDLMKRAVDRGCRYFDYGRSKKGTGQYSFKKHWGFEPKQLHYRYILNKISDVPNINPLNPKYKRKIEVWRKLPLAVTKILGPYIVKNIP
ncbi:FemAB family XrtA/PEP-CTERM system-associated protein [Thermodesulfobacteriota bacterium B35]